MKVFEMSQKTSKNGRRKFKVILHEIYPDSCIDTEKGVGTKFNQNGITWIEEYCQSAIGSIKGKSLRVEFLDDERTEINGHGMTSLEDGVPIFENAVMIGYFEDGYIDTITDDEGTEIVACIGVGSIDASCYNNFCKKLDEDAQNGILPYGSVEIMRKDDEEGIIYKYGYKDKGRIPQDFVYSGYALLGITPADQKAKLLELNNKKEENNGMNETEMKNLIAQVVAEYTNQIAEINQCKSECDVKIAELNSALETVTSEKNELTASSDAIKKALEDCNKELQEAYAKIDGLYSEMDVLRKELGKAQARERVGEMNQAIASFSDEEKAYANAEIEAFNADPINVEINSVVNAILIGIGKKAKEVATVASEQNSAQVVTLEDIFSGVEETKVVEDTNIF